MWGGRTLLPHPPNGARSGTPHIPLLGLRRTHPWEGGELPGFPPTRRTGRWEGPRAPGPAGGERLRRGVTRGPAAAQGARGEALPPSTLLRALIRPPSRGPAGTAKNRLHGHPAARAARPRPREAAPERRRWRSTGRASRPRGC